MKIRISCATLAWCLAVLGFAAGCIHRPAPDSLGVIEGKVVFDRERVAGATIRATAEMGIEDEERTYTTLSDEEGRFVLRLPAGSYMLTFVKEPDLFGFFGGNPVQVSAGLPSVVALRGVRLGAREASSPSVGSRIEGRATYEQRALAGAVIQIFLDARGGFRGPGYALVKSDAEGHFSADLPAGRYFVVGRSREGGSRIGPLDLGDHYGFYPGNPIYLAENQTRVIEMPFLAVEKEPTRALQEASRGATIRGRVIGGKGQGVPGVHACLYRGPEPMGMPAFSSSPTDADGAFTIQATRPGIYWLIARRNIGIPLATGEYVAFYQGRGRHRLEVTAGAHLDGLELRWDRD